MKKMVFYALAASLLFAACQQKESPRGFAVKQLQDSRCFVVLGSGPFYPAGNVIGLENRYSLAWPEEGMLTPDAERELLVRCFGDSVSSTFDEAANHLLYLTWGYEDDGAEIQLLELKTDSIADTLQYTYGHLESTCSVYGDVASFVIKDEINVIGTAHGTYSTQYVNVDIPSGTILHLEDLVDTANLGQAIRMAVSELEVNAEVRDCLFDEFLEADRLPVPVDYVMDSAFSTLTVVYQLYEVAPYACGIQSVVMPVDWLASRVAFTQRGKELFSLAEAVAEAK